MNRKEYRYNLNGISRKRKEIVNEINYYEMLNMDNIKDIKNIKINNRHKIIAEVLFVLTLGGLFIPNASSVVVGVLELIFGYSYLNLTNKLTKLGVDMSSKDRINYLNDNIIINNSLIDELKKELDKYDNYMNDTSVIINYSDNSVYEDMKNNNDFNELEKTRKLMKRR